MSEPEFAWTQDTWPDDRNGGDRRASRRNGRLAWFGVLSLAFITFEFTADPALSTSLGCLKFGWDEVRLAYWLRQTDPDGRRGKVCSSFYLAWGFWRISLIAGAVMLMIAFAHGAIEGRPGPGAVRGAPPRSTLGCVYTMLCGFLLSSTVASFAVFSALRSSVRVWVGPEVRWAREDGIWPPHAARRRRRDTVNRSKSILLSGLITGYVLGASVVIVPLAYAFEKELKSPVAALAFLLTLTVGGPVLILVQLERLGTRIIATTPEACWSGPAKTTPSRNWLSL